MGEYGWWGNYSRKCLIVRRVGSSMRGIWREWGSVLGRGERYGRGEGRCGVCEGRCGGNVEKYMG